MLFGTVTRLCCKSQNHLPSLWARPVYVETSAWFSKFGAKAGLMVLPYGKQRDAAMCFGERFLPSNKTLILYLSCKLHLNRVTHVILLLICFFFFFLLDWKSRACFWSIQSLKRNQGRNQKTEAHVLCVVLWFWGNTWECYTVIQNSVVCYSCLLVLRAFIFKKCI